VSRPCAMRTGDLRTALARWFVCLVSSVTISAV
jgi:hypothetical protein